MQSQLRRFLSIVCVGAVSIFISASPARASTKVDRMSAFRSLSDSEMGRAIGGNGLCYSDNGLCYNTPGSTPCGPGTCTGGTTSYYYSTANESYACQTCTGWFSSGCLCLTVTSWCTWWEIYTCLGNDALGNCQGSTFVNYGPSGSTWTLGALGGMTPC
jgi:hypothetical protein